MLGYVGIVDSKTHFYKCWKIEKILSDVVREVFDKVIDRTLLPLLPLSSAPCWSCLGYSRILCSCLQAVVRSV